MSILAHQGNATKVLLEVVSAIKTFDSIHRDDCDYKEKAAVACTPLLFWLYVTAKTPLDDGVKKIETQPCATMELVQQLTKIESNILAQTVDPNFVFLHSLAAPLE